jgi:hypothetical protein
MMPTHEWLHELYGADVLDDHLLTVAWRDGGMRWSHLPCSHLGRRHREGVPQLRVLREVDERGLAIWQV